ncbi:unnamed protein product, partial [Adineta ricciae]
KEFRKRREAFVRNNCTLNHWSTELNEASSSDGLPKVAMNKFNAYQRALISGVNVD